MTDDGTERPILFSGPMVRAILDGRKTQTRRVLKWIPGATGKGKLVRLPLRGTAIYLDFDGVPGLGWRPVGGGPTEPWPAERIGEVCPYGGPGDRLWVRETFAVRTWDCPVHDEPSLDGTVCNCRDQRRIDYRASDPETDVDRWRPSIHMPRWASRITLEVTDVRVERLQDITCADAASEGSDWENFPELWDDINAKRGFGWGTNPWVWALTFRPEGASP